jgi:very-short-patch-repair endonuclease/predicted transcriptional regulator of viral defense system
MRDAVEVDPAIGGNPPPSSADLVIGSLARSQHGVVARRQLLALGLGDRAIDHRLACGRLHPIRRGVYAVGHAVLTPRGRWLAAVLGAGTGAVLSHGAAAALWGLGPTGQIEVTVPVKRASRPGLTVHASRLAGDETTEVDGIPVTTVARTILDLAAVWPRHRVERALHEAEVRQLTSPTSLDELLRRHPRRRGNSALRSILAKARAGANLTRSELEARFLAFLDAHHLPRPRTNVDVCGFEADCVWSARQLIVELDGHATHVTRAKFERDRVRDRALQIAGWRVVRVTWRQMHQEAGGLAADLLAFLNEKELPLPPT